MKLIFTKQNVRFLAFGALLWMLSYAQLFGQTSSSAYFPLATSADKPVSDTLSGLNLSVLKVSPQAKRGSVQLITLSSGGSGQPYVYQIKYTPKPGFTGRDTFTLELNYIGSYPFLMYRAYQVSVFPSRIFSKADYAVTSINNPVTVDVLANDLALNGPLSLFTIPLVNHGSAQITTDHRILFTPQAGFSGIAQVQYVVCDSLQYCQTEQLSIGVSSNGTLTSDTLQIVTKKGKFIQYPLLDTGFNLFQPPANGLLTLSNNGQVFRYQPNVGFTGMDQFVLRKNIGNTPIYKTVIIRVLNTLSPNVMAVEDVVYTPVGKPITFNVRANDVGNLMVKSWSIPANLPGTVTGTSSVGTVTFTPNTNFTGVATFYYKIGNMNVPDLEIAPVNVVVGNLPPKFTDYHFSTPAATPFVLNYTIPITGFGFSLVQAPQHGFCTFYPGYSTQNINGQSVSGNNLVVYTPLPGFYGIDAFQIKYCPSAGGQCQTESIQMSVVDIAASDPPYCVGDCVWAGDLNKDGIVNNKDLLPLGRSMGRCGLMRPNASLEWYGQFANPWNQPFTTLSNDLKFADADGNGVINAADTTALSVFYGQTHQFTPNMPNIGKGLPFSLKLLTPNPGIGDLVKVAVSIGNTNTPAIDLYGFTFDVQLGSNLVDSALQIHYYPNSWINYNGPSLWMAKNTGPGRLETAFTRTDGMAVSGSGIVAELDFIIIDIVHGGKSGNADVLKIELNAAQILGAGGISSDCPEVSLEIPLQQRIKNREQPGADKGELYVYPNPTANLLQIQLQGSAQAQQLNLTDLTGKTIFSSNAEGWRSMQVAVGNYPSGIYLLSVRTDLGVWMKKIQIQH
jgi:hypothetical protein